MKDEERRLIALLRAEIDTGCQIGFCWQDLTDEARREIIKCSKRHEVAALVADYVIKHEKTDSQAALAELKEQVYKAQMSYVRQKQALKKCTDIFQQEEIPFILLKGAVLRSYYAKPWLRVSADIDILVSKEHYARAISLLKNRQGFAQANTTPHDTAFRLSEGTLVEIHHILIESGRIGRAEKQLDDVWKTASLLSGSEYEMSDEMFYYYHLAHMAKHIERGGCGIRPFIDLWLLHHKLPNNPEREKLLQSGGLLRFAEAATRLSEYWFGDIQPDDDLLLFEKFILEGGVFGSKDNEVKIKSANLHGKAGYMLYKIWMPYPYLCCQYPSLKGKKALQPIYEVRRWLRIILKGNVSYGTDELKRVARLSEGMKETEMLWRYLGF